MNLILRPAVPEDYPVLSDIQAQAFRDSEGKPISPITVEEFVELDNEREPHCRFARWVAEVNGQRVGWAEYDQNASRYHPGKFWIDGYVHPDFQRHGIGSALYERLLNSILPCEPVSLRCDIREDACSGITFLERRGWQEAQRTWESILDVSAFDPTPYLNRLQTLQAEGIQFKNLIELEADPDRDRKLFDLTWEIRQDLPDLDQATKESFDLYVSQRLHHKDLVPEAYFVALQGEKYLGYVYHFLDRSHPERLRIGQLGVARAQRGKGIAQVIKTLGVLYAKAQGYQTIRTTNRSDNQAVLGINTRMGFVRQHAWLHMLKSF